MAHILTPFIQLSKVQSLSWMPQKPSWMINLSCKELRVSVQLRGNARCLRKCRRLVALALENGNSGIYEPRLRKVIEHICLLKTKQDLSEEEENVMLDYLYTTQYQMRGILTISLGRISDKNPEQYTHAVFMRFQGKEDLAKFYENPFYLKVLKEHVMPYCHCIRISMLQGSLNFDYETEVEDDILPIFRKGEEYNYGVELLVLLAFNESSLGSPAEDALTSLATLTRQFPSLIAQATKGQSINVIDTEYTHAVVIRFRSSEAFKMFMSNSEYITMWKSLFEPIIKCALSVHFSVDPIAKELM